MPKRKIHDEYVMELEHLGTGIIVNESYNGANTKIRHTCPICGNSEWYVSPNNVLSGECKKCCASAPVNKKWNNESYSKYLIELNVGIKMTEEFKGTHISVSHTCPICGRDDWKVSPHSIINAGTRRCSNCSSKMTESTMATVLKQVLQKELGAVSEYDAGFRGPNGGIAKYDIYIERYNVLMECQSRYHDNSEVDKLKREYAIEHGYRFMAIDSREYTPLEALQLIFPNIKEIPAYVKLDDKESQLSFSLKEAQGLLDSGKTVTEAAKVLGISYQLLHKHTRKGRLTVINKDKHIKDEVVIEVDNKFELLNRYNLGKELRGFEYESMRKRIRHACKKKPHKYLGHYWYFETDYTKLKEEGDGIHGRE